MEFVSWDDDIPNMWKNKKFQTTNQIYTYAYLYIYYIYIYVYPNVGDMPSTTSAFLNPKQRESH